MIHKYDTPFDRFFSFRNQKRKICEYLKIKNYLMEKQKNLLSNWEL